MTDDISTPIGDRADETSGRAVREGLEAEPEPEREGFGYEMLLRTPLYDLGAETKVEFTTESIRFVMSLPLGPDVVAE